MNQDGLISFEDYIRAYAAYEKSRKNDGNDTAELENRLKKVRDGFRQEYGEILNQYICAGSKTAAVLCQKNHILFYPKTCFFTRYEFGKNPDLEELLIKIDFLAAESSRTLRGRSLKKCLSIIFKLARNTLSLIDSMNNENDDETKSKLKKTVVVIKNNLEQMKKYHQTAAKFSAQKNYLLGNVLGFIGVGFLIVITGFLGKVQFNSIDDVSFSCLIYYGFIGGGIGAIISVMSRLSLGNLKLNIEPDSRSIRMLGIIRPLIGGVFGALILILFNSGFSVFSLNASDPVKILSNFIILGFIAGFFERFVPDILYQTKSSLSSEDAVKN